MFRRRRSGRHSVGTSSGLKPGDAGTKDGKAAAAAPKGRPVASSVSQSRGSENELPEMPKGGTLGRRLAQRFRNFASRHARAKSHGSALDVHQPEVPLPLAKRIEIMYDEFKQPGETVWTEESVGNFFQRSGVEPNSVLSLAILWRFGAASQTAITQDEFVRAMEALNAPDIRTFKSRVPSIRAMLNDRAKFREFYFWIWESVADGDEPKSPRGNTNPLPTVLVVLQLAFGESPFQKHAEKLATFLSSVADIDPDSYRVSFDLYRCILDFFQVVSLLPGGGLTGYDENSSWPVLLDDYANWIIQGEPTADHAG